MSAVDYKRAVKRYFAEKAEGYDLVDRQAYWRLSDRLLRETLTERVVTRLPEDPTILDAGGGTGRWTEFLLAQVPAARGVLYDLSPHMTAQASEKARERGFADRLEIVHGDLAHVEESLRGRRFDLIVNFHNVLGFVADVDDVVRQMAALLAPGGQLVSFVPNRYHAASFNLRLGRVQEARDAIVNRRARFTQEMPAIHLFTPDELVGLYGRHGLEVDLLTGFPNLLYPGHQETQLHGHTTDLQQLLDDEAHFEAIVELERSVLAENDVAARSNNLLAIGRCPG